MSGPHQDASAAAGDNEATGSSVIDQEEHRPRLIGRNRFTQSVNHAQDQVLDVARNQSRRHSYDPTAANHASRERAQRHNTRRVPFHENLTDLELLELAMASPDSTSRPANKELGLDELRWLEAGAGWGDRRSRHHDDHRNRTRRRRRQRSESRGSHNDRQHGEGSISPLSPSTMYQRVAESHVPYRRKGRGSEPVVSTNGYGDDGGQPRLSAPAAIAFGVGEEQESTGLESSIHDHAEGGHFDDDDQDSSDRHKSRIRSLFGFITRLRPQGRALFKRPVLRYDWGQHVERRAEWDELFYDLVVVAFVLVLGLQVKEDLSWATLAYAFAQFFLLQMAWNDYSLYVSRFRQDDFVHKIYNLTQVIGLVGFALHVFNAKTASSGRLERFTLAHAFVRFSVALPHLPVCVFLRRARNTAAKIFLSNMLLSILVVFLSAFAPRPAYVSVVIQVIAACAVHVFEALPWPRRTVAIPIHISHWAERLGLFVMIVLGEDILSLILNDISFDAPSYGFVFLGIFIISAQQILYFDAQPFSPQHHAMRRSIKAGRLFHLCHFVLCYALLLEGVAMKLFLSHINDDVAVDELWLLCGSATLSLLFLFIIRLSHRGVVSELALARAIDPVEKFHRLVHAESQLQRKVASKSALQGDIDDRKASSSNVQVDKGTVPGEGASINSVASTKPSAPDPDNDFQPVLSDVPEASGSSAASSQHRSGLVSAEKRRHGAIEPGLDSAMFTSADGQTATKSASPERDHSQLAARSQSNTCHTLEGLDLATPVEDKHEQADRIDALSSREMSPSLNDENSSTHQLTLPPEDHHCATRSASEQTSQLTTPGDTAAPTASASPCSLHFGHDANSAVIHAPEARRLSRSGLGTIRRLVGMKHGRTADPATRQVSTRAATPDTKSHSSSSAYRRNRLSRWAASRRQRLQETRMEQARLLRQLLRGELHAAGTLYDQTYGRRRVQWALRLLLSLAPLLLYFGRDTLTRVEIVGIQAAVLATLVFLDFFDQSYAEVEEIHRELEAAEEVALGQTGQANADPDEFADTGAVTSKANTTLSKMPDDLPARIGQQDSDDSMGRVTDQSRSQSQPQSRQSNLRQGAGRIPSMNIARWSGDATSSTHGSSSRLYYGRDVWDVTPAPAQDDPGAFSPTLNQHAGENDSFIESVV